MAKDPPKDRQHRYAWPLGINLVLLLLLVGLSWPHVYSNGLALLLLAIINLPIGFLFFLFERPQGVGYAGGFVLSFLLLLIIGFGMCSKDYQRHHEVDVIEATTSTP